MKGQNFSFMKEMVPMIIVGRKIITNRIATPFRRKLEVGGIMHIFTGLRTSNCKKIGTAKVIDKVYWTKNHMPGTEVAKLVSSPPLEECDNSHDFAWIDGFDWYSDFYDYFINRKGKADECGFVCYKFEFSVERVV
ncbi:MAG: hypothetical protein KAR08_08140 [Candidatus Heimdallarchaeota archaeon]|nr:hypothetical protein [Candidatus Heimdallarchaeota archaeon]